MNRANVAIVITTLNEEKNLAFTLETVCGWAREVFVVDSFSTDQTRSTAERFDCTFIEHRFAGYSSQLNWALDNLPIEAEWILFLDADEWLPEALKTEISELVARAPAENGFALCRKFLWMGKWIRRGYYPTWIVRLVRRGKARWEDRPINQHLIVEGEVGKLTCDFIHEDRKGLCEWTMKHVQYARKEACELFAQEASEGYLQPRFFGNQAERTRWLRYKIYNRLPIVMRPLLYFGYIVVIRRGMLDGIQAVIYHFLHALWCPLMIDLLYVEMRAGKLEEASDQ